jgi:hypothetical protein
MAISAFIVPVPAAEPLVGDLRRRYDETAALGVPAHITLLVPFMAPERITVAVLDAARHALSGVRAFPFSLGTVARFPATTYLAPDPPSPFIAMTRALVEAFPEFPSYGGEHDGVIPHLTVAHGSASDADAAAADLRARLNATGPVMTECTSVTLLANASGRWEALHVFRLPVPELRLQYEAAVIELGRETRHMLASGMSEEQVARWVVDQRNQLKQKFRDLTPPSVLARIEAWTQARYGNALGPSADQLHAGGKSWLDIVNAAARPGETPPDVTRPGPAGASNRA